MLRRSVLESRLSAQHTSVMPQRGHNPTSNRSWPHRVGVVILGVLSLAWTIHGVAATDPAGFTQHCSGLAQDPLLGALWPGTLEQEWRSVRCPHGHGTTLILARNGFSNL